MAATDLDRLSAIIEELSDEDIRRFAGRFDQATQTVRVRVGAALRHLRSALQDV